MQLISTYNNGFLFFLCVVNFFSKYAKAAPLKDKKGITFINTFKKLSMNPDTN